MKSAKRKSPARRRNLAARALRDPLFRPKVMANPNAYKRRPRHVRKPEDDAAEEMNSD